MDIEHKADQDRGRDWLSNWTHYTEGWREVLSRCSHALTHFAAPPPGPESPAQPDRPHWGLLPGELRETAEEVVLRMEAPGIAKADCQILVDGQRLRIRGEKMFTAQADDGVYHLAECAYGRFERIFVLPHRADPERAQASMADGVLTVRMPKRAQPEGRAIDVQ